MLDILNMRDNEANMLNKNFPLYHKIYQLLKILYKTVKSFSKEYKYSLGRDIIDLTWQCLDLTMEANNLANENKKEKIKELNLIFDKLKMRIRMGQEINLISVRQFAHLEENYIAEIGNQIGGWMRWAGSAEGGY